MKKSINEIDIYKAVSCVSDDLIENSMPDEMQNARPAKILRWIKPLGVAACLVLTVSVMALSALGFMTQNRKNASDNNAPPPAATIGESSPGRETPEKTQIPVETQSDSCNEQEPAPEFNGVPAGTITGDSGFQHDEPIKTEPDKTEPDKTPEPTANENPVTNKTPEATQTEPLVPQYDSEAQLNAASSDNSCKIAVICLMSALVLILTLYPFSVKTYGNSRVYKAFAYSLETDGEKKNIRFFPFIKRSEKK